MPRGAGAAERWGRKRRAPISTLYGIVVATSGRAAAVVVPLRGWRRVCRPPLTTSSSMQPLHLAGPMGKADGVVSGRRGA